MKFKDLLIESTTEDNFLSLFKSDKLFPTERMDAGLWRGTNRKIETVTLHKPRTDRRPLHTNVAVDHLIELYRQKKYDDVPSRRSSVFAVADVDAASEYGWPQLIFVPKSARIFVYRDIDSIEQTNRISNALSSFFRTYAKYKDDLTFSNPKMKEWLESNTYAEIRHEKNARYLIDNLNYFQVVDASPQVNREWFVAVDLLRRTLDRYFSDWNESKGWLYSGNEEIMIDTPFYFYVNPDWFFNAFPHLAKSWDWTGIYRR